MPTGRHIRLLATAQQCTRTSLRTRLCRPRLQQAVPQLSQKYAVQAPGTPTFDVFNHQTKWLQKERAAKNAEQSRQVDYLRDEVAFRLCERLLDINRHFPKVLDLGANACNIAKILTRPPEDRPAPTESQGEGEGESIPEQDQPNTNDPSNIPGTASQTNTQSAYPGTPTSSDVTSPLAQKPLIEHIAHILAAESSPSLLNRDINEPWSSHPSLTLERQVLDHRTELLPFSPNTFDAVLSSLSLHWMNDLPSVLSQINAILKPDSPFLGVMLGGDSLYELRTSLQLASQDRLGGMKPHLSPLADVRDMGGLMQKAGFQLLTIDVDDIAIDYPSSFALMADLQAMGEANALVGREPAGIRRDVLAAAESIYKELHGNEDGSVPATFRLIYMIGWKAGPNQAKPLERGTGMFSIKDILEKQGGNIDGSDGGGKDGKK